MQAPIPINEPERLEALAHCNLLDTPPEHAFDRISRVAAQLFSTPIAAVSLLGENRQFFKSIVGLDIRETARDVSFCAHAILDRDPLVVLDALLDPRFRDNPLVTEAPGIRFYCGAPMETPEGFRIGTLCVIDTEPRAEVRKDLLDLLVELAAQTSAEIVNRKKDLCLANTSTVLLERERELEREKELRHESEIRADLALEASHMGSWDWDAQSGHFKTSSVTRQLFGFHEGKSQSTSQWFKRIHREDRWRLLKLLKSAKTSLADFTPEFRIAQHEGESRWLAVKGRTVCTSEGKVKGAKGVCWDVTERRLQQERLRESEEIFRAISVSCPVGIFSADLQGQVCYSNPRAQEIWGMTEEELRGSGWMNRLHPDDASSMVQSFLQANASGLGYEKEYRLLLPDNNVRWVHARGTLIPDRNGAPVASVGTVDDITERKRLEYEQYTSQELTRRILDSSADCIKILDLEGRLLLMSPGGVRALCISDLPSLIGKKYFDLWTGEYDRAAAIGAFQLAISGETASFQGYFPGVNGQPRWWDTSFCPIVDKAGTTERILAVSRDLTDLRRASEEQEKARRLAEEANQAKSLFLANVSHELRTPLNGVLATTELLLSSQLDLEQRELAHTIKHSGEALLHLVDDLLDLGRMEAGKLTCQMEPFNLRSTVDRAVALVAPAAREKRILLSANYLGSVPELLLGDEARIGQTLVNYLNNALKFTDQGSISLHVSVEISPNQARRLLIAVYDTGPGISDEAQAALFKPFQQVDGSTTRKHGGLGLGLSISRHLAEAMGGSVGVQSALGKGSTFWVRLPLLVDPQGTEHRAEAPICKLTSVNDLRVLVAEDNPINQKVILRLLAKLGCLPELAPNGEVAVQMFRTKRYDFVLMDCQMPELDGYEATRQIREMEHQDALSRTPIVAVTAHGMAGDRERCLASGMDDHLVKPLTFLALQAALNKWRASVEVSGAR